MNSKFSKGLSYFSSVLGCLFITTLRNIVVENLEVAVVREWKKSDLNDVTGTNVRYGSPVCLVEVAVLLIEKCLSLACLDNHQHALIDTSAC